MTSSDTIVACCTAQGSGAVALIRVSGFHAISMVNRIAQLSSGKSLDEVTTHTIHHGYIVESAAAHHAESRIDEVLFFVMHAPRTFTGEQTVEITTHQNPFIIEKVIACLIACGARRARPGEFSERAYLNGKLDLLQVEALAELIGAHSEQTTRMALAQLHGSLSREMVMLEEHIMQLLCFVEASFEFLDEEQRDLDFDMIVRQRIEQLRERVRELMHIFDAGQLIRQGARVALIGPVNAGKSTLLNTLIGHERAIVSSEPGTTRDTIEFSLTRTSGTFTLVDTAGIRETDNIIERTGIERSWREARAADLILLVLDATRGLDQLDAHILYEEGNPRDNLIVVINKSDVAEQQYQEELETYAHQMSGREPLLISARESYGMRDLELEIVRCVTQLLHEGGTPFLITKRQHSLLCELDVTLATVTQYCQDTITYELVAHHVRDALCRVGELTGKGASEKMLDAVFREFCIGK